jgi:hypothetical protein
MTPKQIERVKKQIASIKRALAAEKKEWGGVYDDSRGRRYLPMGLYVKIQDYKGCLTYSKWFHKNFPDDCCFPEFLFEWTIILYKSGKLKEAERKAFRTYCSNTYLFDTYFGRPIAYKAKEQYISPDSPEYLKHFTYSCKQEELTDFTDWLKQFTEGEMFIRLSNKFIEIENRLKMEEDRETRGYLLQQASQLENEF